MSKGVENMLTVAYKLYSIENGEKDFEEEAPVEHPFQFISGLGMTLEPFEVDSIYCYTPVS